MTTLRVLIDDLPASDRAFDYAVVDDAAAGAAHRRVRRGKGTPSQWPATGRTEVVIAAALLRVATLRLPPISAARINDSARFALDDQLAAAADSMHVATGVQAADGRILAVALSRELMKGIVAHVPKVSRIVAEPALLPVDGDWHWARDQTGRGFLLRPDGSAVAVHASAGIPPEIALAIRHAARAGSVPARIVAHADREDAAADASAQAATASIDGVAIVPGATWCWDGSGAIAADANRATDLRQGEFADGVVARSRDAGRKAWRPAISMAVRACAVFAVASVATWIYYRIDAWRDQRVAIALAAEASVTAVGFDDAIAAITRRYADAQHARGAMAPGDALPMLARAAPALAALPTGRWKRAIYSGGAWTLEFSALDVASRETLVRRLGDAGLTALVAEGAGGVRVRLQP